MMKLTKILIYRKLNFKKILFSTFVISLFTFSGIGYAQDIIIGTDTSSIATLPTSVSNYYTYSQQIYLQSEINTSGKICALSFFHASSIDVSRTISIYLGETNKPFFSSNGDWVSFASLSHVFYGTVHFNDSNWVTINFDTPFEYHNIQNLVVAIDDNSGTIDPIGSNFQCHNTLNNRSLRISSIVNPNPQFPSFGISGLQVNNIIFHFCSPTPMSAIDINSCDLLYSDPGGLNDYQNNTELIQTIHSDPLENNVLNMHFIEFSLAQGDSLWIYDGSSIFNSLIGCFTNSNFPPTLTASTNSFTFRFKSDITTISSGWLAHIKCQPCSADLLNYESPCMLDTSTITGYSAIPFCTDSSPSGVSFPSAIGGVASNGQIGCLTQTANPTWYFMKINNPGDLLLRIHQIDTSGNNSDIDFACWGPFYGENHLDYLRRFCCGESELFIEPTTFHYPTSPLGDHTNDMGMYPINNLIDCSNSGLSTEYCFIPDAQSNSYYLLLLINKAGSPGTISFNTVSQYTQATTDCSLIALASNEGPICVGQTIYLHSNYAPTGATFQWSGPNGFTSTAQHPVIPNASEINSGDYSVIVTSGIEVSNPAVTHVEVYPFPNITFYPSSPYICAGDSLFVTAFGATNYYWPTLLDSGDTQLISAPITTTFTVIGESNGCSTTASFLLDVKEHPTTNIILPPANIVLNDSIINVYAITTDGTPDYFFEWSGTNVTPVNNDSIVVPIDSTECNSILHFSLMVFDAYGCRATDRDSISVFDTIAPIFVNTPYPIQIAEINNSQFQIPNLYDLIYNNISDNIWNNSHLTITQSPTAGTIITDNDTVTITISDPCGNINTITIPIFIPLSSEITMITPIICNGSNTGMAVATGFGGLPPYSYSWNTNPVQNNDTVFNLIAGTYIVTITDFLNQSIIDTITFNTPPSLTLSISGITNVCPGDSTASITIHTTGGLSPYEYEWNVNSFDSTLNNLPAGYYSVMVTDAYGCWDTTSIIISNYDQPSITLTPSANNVCPNFGIVTTSSSISGGLPPYNYFWDCHGSIIAYMPQLSILIDSTNCNYIDTMIFQVTDAHGCKDRDSVFIHVIDTTNPIFNTLPFPIQYATFVTSNYQIPDFHNLILNNIADNCWIPSRITITQNPAANTIINSNTYVTITITDPCGNSNSTIIRVIIPLTASITNTTHVSCYGTNTGSATVTAQGGITPYSYHWSTTPTQTGSTASNLIAGNYTVTITDSLGVTTTTSVQITQPAILTATITPTHVLCNGGTTGAATLSVSGGTTPYQYLWNGGATSQNRTNLTAGTYTVTITDFKGCTKTSTVTITQPTIITPTTVSLNSHCNENNGILTISTSGGVTPYQYIWSNSIQNDTINNLAAGIYTCTITDGNNCTKIISDTIFATPMLTIDQVITNPETCAQMNGSIEVDVSAGTPPYQYSWSFGTSHINTLNQIPEGTYSVTVTDQDGCTQSEEITIENLTIQLSVASTTPSSCGENNGSVTINVISDFVDYTFDWGPIIHFNNNSATQLAAGNYNVIVSSGDCSAALDFTIDDIPGPYACFSIEYPFGNGINIPINFDNCSSNSDNWYWSFGDFGISNIENPSHVYIQEGDYVVTLVVTNEFGCIDSVAQIVSIIGNSDIYIPNSFTPNDDGLNDIFYPVIKEINNTGYSLKIYNRLGQLVFVSNHIELGWDGKINGIPAEGNTYYTYVIFYENRNGRKMKANGSVSIIK